jgi:hypothetical protein
MTDTSDQYITEQEFRDYIKTPSGDKGKNEILGAISAASRSVDSFCGRYFNQRDETQYFSANPKDPNCLWILPLDDMDLATTSGLTVSSETGNDGTYPLSWTVNVDFIAEPINQSQNGITPWPYTSLRSIGTHVWPIRFIEWQRPTVKIVGRWGWPVAPPDPVKRATAIIANQLWKLGEAPLGVAGWGSYGDIRVREIPQAASLLAPYRKVGTMGIA